MGKRVSSGVEYPGAPRCGRQSLLDAMPPHLPLLRSHSCRPLLVPFLPGPQCPAASRELLQVAFARGVLALALSSWGALWSCLNLSDPLLSLCDGGPGPFPKASERSRGQMWKASWQGVGFFREWENDQPALNTCCSPEARGASWLGTAKAARRG